ncbi:MAG: hypothetical protein NUV56_02210, partial [Candidatus Uhrbacteria bacterium]|nr:hypothetical protein [Candidatus Uhrbacteria bacterium]
MSLFPLDPKLVMSEVYSLYFTETKEVVRELRMHPDFDKWFDEAWLGRENGVPAEYLETWRTWSGLPLDGYPHRYVGNGSSEIIRELMQPRYDGGPTILTFDGEYDGYGHVSLAHGLGAPIKICRPRYGGQIDIPLDRSLQRHDVRPVFWISQPSALDGEYQYGIQAVIDRITRPYPQARFVIDVSYHGLTKAPEFMPELLDPRISAVVFSLSKVFGLYKWRVGGVFSREPIPGLAYNHHFNGHFGLK